MQAIITKFLAPGNVRGSRFKATAARGSITVSADHALNADENHVAAARALVAKFLREDEEVYRTPRIKNPWGRRFVSGSLPSGDFAHVFTDSR